MGVRTEDRRATRRELLAARRRVLREYGGPGLLEAARLLSVSVGWLSEALRGRSVRRLTLSELRTMQEAELGKKAATK